MRRTNLYGVGTSTQRRASWKEEERSAYEGCDNRLANLERCKAGGSLATFVVAAAMRFSVLVIGVLSYVGVEAAPIDMRRYAGFNVENPQWMSRAKQDDVIGHLVSQGVTLIRFPLVPSSGLDFTSIVGFTERAFKAGIQADVIVSPSFRSDAPSRPAVAGTLAAWPMPGLTSADPQLFTRNYEPVLRQLDQAGVILAGLELGNEINWPQYNGDFAVPGRGRSLSLRDLETSDLGRKVAKGFRAYLATLRALKAIRDGSRNNAKTPIVMAGLAEISPGSPPPADKVDDVDIATTIDFMRANGADSLVDVYGVHTYAADGVVDTEASRRGLATYLDRYILSRCAAGSGEKPCWITEWGATQPSGCPFVEGTLSKKIGTFLDVIRPKVQSGAVRALFYADWADPARRGLYRCGRLSAAGRLYLDYFRADQPGAGARSSPSASHNGAKR